MARKKIMVIDDEPVTVKLIQTRLEKSGFEVVGVCDSRTAMDKVKKEEPQLIILDILMPDLDGMELGQMLKQDPATRDIPIIFLTALKRRDEGMSGRKNPESVVLAKPFDPAELLKEIEQALNQTGGETS